MAQTYNDFIMATSPVFITYSGTASMWDYITVDLYIYEGGKTASVPSTPIDTLTAYKLQSTDTNVYVEISDYIKGYLDPQILDDNYFTGGTISIIEAVWVKSIVKSYKIVDSVGALYQTITQTKPATLGYGFTEDGANPVMGTTNSLISQSDRFGVSGYYHYDVDINTTTNLSSELFTRTIGTDFKPLCAGENGLMQVLFLNKFGVLDSFDFSRKKTRSVALTSSKYDSYQKRPDAYNYRVATQKVYNINATEKWVLNTDLLDDEANELMEQMCLSDRWWIFNGETGFCLPAILTNKAFDEKRAVNEKAKIQWSFEFEMASSKINDIR